MNKLIANFIILLSLTLSCLSCSKFDLNNKDPYGLKDLNDNSVVATGSAIEGAVDDSKYFYILDGRACVTLKGSVDLSATALGKYKLGFVYGENEDITIESCENKVTTNSLENNTYSIPVSDLIPGRSYYYRSFLSINGNDYYGKVKSFTAYCPRMDDYVGNYPIEYFYAITLLGIKTVDVTASCRITKKGKELSVEVPIFKFDLFDYKSFDYKTFRATLTNGSIVFKDDESEIIISVTHKTDKGYTIQMAFASSPSVGGVCPLFSSL